MVPFDLSNEAFVAYVLPAPLAFPFGRAGTPCFPRAQACPTEIREVMQGSVGRGWSCGCGEAGTAAPPSAAFTVAGVRQTQGRSLEHADGGFGLVSYSLHSLPNQLPR